MNDQYYGCDGAGYKYSGRGCCGEGIGDVLLIVMSTVWNRTDTNCPP